VSPSTAQPCDWRDTYSIPLKYFSFRCPRRSLSDKYLLFMHNGSDSWFELPGGDDFCDVTDLFADAARSELS
jgi:hypothetical protein